MLVERKGVVIRLVTWDKRKEYEKEGIQKEVVRAIKRIKCDEERREERREGERRER